MASSKFEDLRNSTIARSGNAAEDILEYPEVQAALGSDTYSQIRSLVGYLYVPNVKDGRLTTPREYANDTSIALTALHKDEIVSSNIHIASIHALQGIALSEFAVSNGMEQGELGDSARLAIDEAFRDHPTLEIDDPRKEKTVSSEATIALGPDTYRLRGKPALILLGEGYQRPRHNGLALIEQLVRANKILRASPLHEGTVETEFDEEEKEIATLMQKVSEASLPLIIQASSENRSRPLA